MVDNLDSSTVWAIWSFDTNLLVFLLGISILTLASLFIESSRFQGFPSGQT